MGLRLKPQRVFDISIVALAVGCASVGYYSNANEDKSAKRSHLQREQVRRDRLKAEESKRYLEKLKSVSKHYEENVELLLQKRQEMQDVLEQMQSLTGRLQKRHKELESKIEELRRLVKEKEDLQTRSQALGDSRP